MLNTYIKNRGITQTIIQDNGNSHINELNWNADYDGDIAKISLDSNTNGNKEHYVLKLNNEDLANMLNAPSVNTPIHKRLEMDFFPNEQIPIYKMTPPNNNDELVIPLTIYKRNKRAYHHHKRSKTHKNSKSHKTHKKTKSHKRSKSHKKSINSPALIDLIKNSV